MQKPMYHKNAVIKLQLAITATFVSMATFQLNLV